VFALPSTEETPGISALEAAVAGAKVLITRRGGAQEYLEGFAEYVDWHSQTDISEKLALIWNKSVNTMLQREHILGKFSWTRVAELTNRVYEEIAGSSEGLGRSASAQSGVHLPC
jgi:glycosyltransferase involved in cell wall biosynthesis